MTDARPRSALLFAAFGLALLQLGCGVFGGKTPPPKPPLPSALVEPTERTTASTTTFGQRPAAHSARVGPYVFNTEFPLETRDPMFRELEELPEQIETELKLPVNAGLIHVFLFDTEEKYHAYLKAKDPKLPLRSAYFFSEPSKLSGAGPDLHVYTWAGPRLRTDLRHELTHALLHGTLKTVPLWLDEGLAGFFEQPPANGGVNPLHLDALRNGETLRDGTAFKGDLARLERLSKVDQMGRPEYQEAWAWVHFMLKGNPKARPVLMEYLQGLRTTANVGSLQPKLEAALGDATPQLTAYLNKLDLPPMTNRIRAVSAK